MTSQAGEIHVMLVDDSAVIRGALTKIIDTDSSVRVVESINNGELAIKAAEKSKPHIVILDIEMPVMDGLTALPKILEASPKSKVIMFSSLTESGADVSLKALSLGAVECIVKPSSTTGVGEGSQFQKNLLNTIKSLVPEASRAAADPSSPAKAAPAPKPASTAFSLYDDSASYKGKPEIIVIGSSTGGPQALFEVIKNFKDFDIPIVITQHMPATFTKLLAEHIKNNTGLEAFEGAEGMSIEKGKVYVAPGGFHMKLVKNGLSVSVKVDDGPPENFCKPSVDPMFRSALEIYGQKILGVMLTGMGNDGLPSSKDLVESGARLIAQDEATSVVWGMPGAVAQAGICSAVLPLQEIGPWVKKVVTG